MTFGEMQAALADWLAVNDKRLPVSARKHLINLALVELQRMELWRFCYYQTTFTVLAGSGTAQTPQDMIEPDSLAYRDSVSGVYMQLGYLPPSEFQARYDVLNISPGTPEAYTIIGTNIVLSHKPTVDTQFVFTYYRLLPELVADSDTNDFLKLAWDAVLFAALEKAVVFGIEDARAPLFAQLKQQALQKILVNEGRLGGQQQTYRPKSRIPDV
jgi:hypothetical protein